jgi:DNA-binding beta-propeller fold protein YncE
MKRIALLVFVVVFASSCFGQWLERKVSVGDTIGFRLDGGIVVNPVSGNVYIESDPTQVFDPAAPAKVRRFDVKGSVVFCPPSGKGYVIGNPVVILDAVADTALGTTTIPFIPASLAYSTTSNRLYLGSPNDTDRLFVFDPDGDSVLATVAVGYQVTALLWDSAWNRLYVGTRSDSGLLKVLDCTADTLLGDVQLGLTEMSLLALGTASNKLYCAGVPDTSGGDAVIAVNTDSLKPIGGVPGLPLPVATAYNPTADRLYCLNSRRDSLFVVDCPGDTVRSRLALKLRALATSTLDGKVYVGQRDAGPVLVLDTGDAVVDSISVPIATSNNVGALAFSSARDEIYVALTDDFAFVIDAATDSISGLLDYIAYSPSQMVYNPAGSKLYLLCPAQDAVLGMDSTYATTAFVYRGVTNTDAIPVLDSSLNRLYVVDNDVLRVLDCNSDSMVRALVMYGINHPVPVLVPGLNKLYVFAGYGAGDSVYEYDCERDALRSLFHLSDAAPCAVYDSVSSRVFFACEDQPTVRVLDPISGSVVKTFDLGAGSTAGRMAVNPGLGRLYYSDQGLDRLFTIDVRTDSVTAVTRLPWDIDTLILNQRLNKLYLCSRDVPTVLAFDCREDSIVATIPADFHHAALMNDRNDKLYLRYGVVVYCRYDEVVTRLDSINQRCMAWDVADNRVFEADLHRLYVYRDDPSGVEERQFGSIGPMLAVLGNPARNVVNLRLQIPRGQTGSIMVHDAAGRLVHSSSGLRTQSYRVDLASMPAGVYFVSLEVGRTRATDEVVVERRSLPA